MKAFNRTLLGVFITLFAVNCGNQSQTAGIELKVEISPKLASYDFSEMTTLTDKLYAKLKTEWVVRDKDERLSDAFQPYIRLSSESDSKIAFQYPCDLRKLKVLPISKWKKGEKINFTKEILIPKFLKNYGLDFKGYDLFILEVGLSDPKKKIQIPIYQKQIRMEAEESHRAAIDYQKGWHGIEQNPVSKDPDLASHRWTSEAATCIVDNKNYRSKNPRNYRLIIKGGVTKSILPEQSIEILIGDKQLLSFVPKSDFFVKEFRITPELMGQKSSFELRFQSDKTFIPSQLNPDSSDNRKLGIRIYNIYFRQSD